MQFSSRVPLSEAITKPPIALMDWLLSLLPLPVYYATVFSFLLTCLYLFSADFYRLLNSLVEKRARLRLLYDSDEEINRVTSGEVESTVMAFAAFSPLAKAQSDPTLRNSSRLNDQDGGSGTFAYLGKSGKWKTGIAFYEPGVRAVVLRKLPNEKSADKTRVHKKIVSLDSVQQISLKEADAEDTDSIIIQLQYGDEQLTLRSPKATGASKWLQHLLEELVRIRPKLAIPRAAVSDQSITEKLKLVCETDTPSFSVDLVSLLLKEFGVFAKRTDIKTHLQKTTGKVKLETYRDTVDAVKEIMGQFDLPEIFQRYATVRQSNGTLMSVIDFHRFVTESQGLQQSLPETMRLLKSVATCDSDLLDLLLVSRRVFKVALNSKLFTLPLNPEQTELKLPLDLPLTDYFISTSHNTYLMEDQLKGRSDCLAYEIALKKNCRCVELDIHNGPNNDPIITHGGTMTSRIRFEDVIKTIRKFAFVASEYPLILSFENHCSLEQQDRMAQILNTHLKDFLYVDENSEIMNRLPCPEDLKRKIIIKNKKSADTGAFSAFSSQATDADGDDDSDEESEDEIQGLSTTEKYSSLNENPSGTPPITLVIPVTTEEDIGAEPRESFQSEDSAIETTPAVSEYASIISDENSPDCFQIQSTPLMDSPLARRFSSEKIPPGVLSKKRKKLKVSHSLSDLVSICRPVKFKGLKFARENYRPVEMSSLVEGKMDKKQWLKKDGEDANKFVLHTQYQLVRTYPSGLRTNSSNYNPINAWRFGCQLVALNYQTRCENMEINDGLFQLNGACGYVAKPAILTDPDTKFNPFSPTLKLARNLHLEIISGANLRHVGKEAEEKNQGLSPYVKVTLFGVPGDERKDQTKKADQGFNPRWNYRCFEENKLVKVPDLAHLRLEVKDKTCSKVIGQYTAPLTAFNKGYRRIFLKDSKDGPTPSELWIRFKLLEL